MSLPVVAGIIGAAPPLLTFVFLWRGWAWTAGQPFKRFVTISTIIVIGLILTVLAKEFNRELVKQALRSQGVN